MEAFSGLLSPSTVHPLQKNYKNMPTAWKKNAEPLLFHNSREQRKQITNNVIFMWANNLWSHVRKIVRELIIFILTSHEEILLGREKKNLIILVVNHFNALTMKRSICVEEKKCKQL